MNKWIRVTAMIASFVISTVLLCIPNVPTAVLSIFFVTSILIAVWNMWKNNDFTKAAELGTAVTHAIKDGKITAEEVQEILKTAEVENNSTAK